MKHFESVEKAREWARQYRPIDVNPEWYIYIKDKQLLAFGDWILFQHIKYERKSDTEHQAFASRPLFGLFTNWTLWDMALVLNFVEKPRAYMHHCTTEKDEKWVMPIYTNDDDVQTFQQWTENIHMLGIWKNKPSITELKTAYANKL